MAPSRVDCLKAVFLKKKNIVKVLIKTLVEKTQPFWLMVLIHWCQLSVNENLGRSSTIYEIYFLKVDVVFIDRRVILLAP